MSAARGRRSRESRASPSERRKDSKTMNSSEKKFLRTLLRVLEKVVADDGMATTLDESDSELEAEMKKDAKGADARDDSGQPQLDQASFGNLKMELCDKTKIVDRFKKLHEDHGQLNRQLQGSLNALGGGGRTAKALRILHKQLTQIIDMFFLDSGRYILLIYKCMTVLNSSKEATSEVADAFKELGVFDKSFFDTLKRITKRLENIALRIEMEYGAYRECHVDQYIGSVFEPLIEDFDIFVSGLTYIAEKEIATIRNAQDFSSQRYLNLTTVATFLSSVTATTLQITTSDSGSTLTSVANTLWLISLVFSTASAVYSLLVMTWRQSSVCQPNKSLPSYLKPWFRNGPMYSLSAAVMAFSIGLCLLAFHVSIAQGGFASAMVPTAFAGVHAYAILLFSAFFLLEKWKARHKESWFKIRDACLTLAKKAESKVETLKHYGRRAQESPGKLKDCGRLVRQHLARPISSFTNQIPTFRRRVVDPCSVQRSVSDIELGKSPVSISLFGSDLFLVASNQGQDATPATVGAPSDEDEPIAIFSEQAGEAMYAPEAAEPDNALAIPEVAPLSESDRSASIIDDNDSDDETEDEYKPCVNLLQFSPNGKLLASAFSDIVTVYDVVGSFTVLGTLKIPDADQVRQIEWNSRLYGLDEELLVRSLTGVSVWNVWDSKSSDGRLVGHLKESVVSVKWTSRMDSGIEGFVCVSDCIIRLFNEKCEEVRLIDLSKMRKVNRITHAEFFREKYVVCLANVPDDSDCDRLLVVNWKASSVVRFDLETYRLKYTLKGKQSDKRAEDGSWTDLNDRVFCVQEDPASWQQVEVAEMLISESDDDFTMAVDTAYNLWAHTKRGHELSTPEAAVMFHGQNDSLIVGYSSGEVAMLYHRPSDWGFSALHIFTTPTADAILQNPVSFAINKGRHSHPYMFAFGDDQGTVKVWSVQSNRELSESGKAGMFEVHDRGSGFRAKTTITTGRFLTLQPDRIHGVDDTSVARLSSDVS